MTSDWRTSFLNHRLLHWKEVQGGGYRMQMMQLADTSSSICLFGDVYIYLIGECPRFLYRFLS